MAETTAAIIYDEATRAIARQQTVLDGVRTRAGTLFAAASLVTAFLGGQALTHHPALDFFAWAAIVVFVLLFASVLAILWPWRFQFVMSAKILIEDHSQKAVPDLQTYLAETWERNYDTNQLRIDRLFSLFRVACGFLSLEVVAWLVSLGRG
jgi:hypothetical protein